MAINRKKTHNVHATFLYSGMPDYWKGDGSRWDDDNGCLFAYYDHTTTLRQLIDNWVSDFANGGDCDTIDENITELDIKVALLEMLSPAGVQDYHGDELAGCAKDYRDANTEEDLANEDWESPFAVVLIETEPVDQDDGE